jgi:enoyl-CoA hydratase/carnithine racemase
MSTIRTQNDGAVRHVIFAREQKRNAMSMQFIADLDSALLDAQTDSSVRCVIIRGDGPMFSAGIDIEALNDFSGGIDRLRPTRDAMIRCFNRCEEMTKPVIVQAHGAVIGAAMELALACDMRICTEETVWSLPEVKIGLIPDVGGSARLPAIVGLGRAKELIMTGKFIDGKEAERIGLANKAVPAAQLEEATQSLVGELLACAPIAVGLAKRVLDGIAKPALALNLEHEVTAQTVCAATEDFVEGATAVKERRQPVFKGV